MSPLRSDRTLLFGRSAELILQRTAPRHPTIAQPLIAAELYVKPFANLYVDLYADAGLFMPENRPS
jgi:hypothetical protein